MKKENDRPNRFAKILKKYDETTFPNLFTFIKTVATPHVTSYECQRSFSVNQRLQMWVHALMTSDRLSAHALMKAIERFLNLHPRKVTALNLISSNETKIGTQSFNNL